MSVVLLAEMSPATPPPMRMGTAEEFAAARRCLEQAGYTEEAVCAFAGVPAIESVEMVKDGRAPRELTDGVGALVHLFMDSEPLARERAEALLPEGAVEALLRLGLLVPSVRQPGALSGTVSLYPLRSLYIVSDANGYVDGGAVESPADVVYPAIGATSRDYLTSLPDTPCDRLLEVCGGTGIAALVSAPFAGHAWTSDITARSTFFAEFNARLNGIGNVTAVQGNLYSGVRGMLFDRIAAHPPYVATDEATKIFRDGGRDGEEVTRALVERLPDVLAPGGRFYCTCTATDRTDAPLEQRLRGMLGSHADEFDVLVVVRHLMDAAEYNARLAVVGRASFAQAERRVAACRELQIESVVYCSMLLVRHESPRAPVTVRETMGTIRVADALEWRLRHDALARDPGYASWLRSARPTLASEAVMTARLVPHAGRWANSGAEIVVEAPFRTDSRCSPDTAAVLVRFDGTVTVAELAGRLAAEREVASETVEPQMLELARFFIERGVLRVPELPLEGAAARAAVPPSTPAQ